MTLDLKWFLPFVAPFALLLTSKVLWWLAGAHFEDPNALAETSMVVGFLTGVAVVVFMSDEGIKWSVKIGGKK